MYIQLRLANERGHYDHGWLDTSHTFSFANYYDPQHMGYRVLRVINQDIVAPGRGFGMHPHHDMEIVTYVLEGELGHRDSMGHGSVIRPGDVQRLSAGTGVTHSEMNASTTMRVHFLQIWIVPDQQGYPPSYEQQAFTVDERRDKLRVVASPDGRDGSIKLHQDATISASLLSPGQRIEHTLDKNRYAWLQLARGSVALEAHKLSAGDGAAIRGPGTIVISGVADAELLLFDLP